MPEETILDRAKVSAGLGLARYDARSCVGGRYHFVGHNATEIARADDHPLVFAGLWDLWLDSEGRPLRSCTIITTAANKSMAPVHHRMPVVLPRDA